MSVDCCFFVPSLLLVGVRSSGFVVCCVMCVVCCLVLDVSTILVDVYCVLCFVCWLLAVAG